MASDVQTKMLKLSSKISKLGQQESEVRGVLKRNKQRLDKEFGCKSESQGKAVLAKMKKEAAELEEEIREGCLEIEAELE